MAEAEQLDETTVVVDDVEIDPSTAEAVNEEVPEEFDIVLAGQDEAEEKPDPKTTADHILSRVMRKKGKLEDENVQLRQQLQAQQAQPVAPAVQPVPDEYAFDDRNDYLTAKASYDRQMLTDVVSQQLNQQQNGSRIEASNQQQAAALKTYAETAASLKVSDFNDTQDKAFDVLGDDLAQMIATKLPKKAPKLLYWFGKNPEEAAKMAESYKANPGNATFDLGELAGKLTIQPKRTKAAQPESKVESGSVGGINDDWQKEWEKLNESSEFSGMSKTINARRELKKRAKAAGFDTSALK